MKRILKGLFVVVTSLGCIGLQAEEDQYITSIEGQGHFIITVYEPLGQMTVGPERDLLDSRNVILSHLTGPLLNLKKPIYIGNTQSKYIPRVHILNVVSKKAETLTLSQIRQFDEENVSGKWLLKIEKERVSFAKPADA